MATKKIIINRKQFKQLKSIFEKNKDLEYELEHGEKKLTAKKRLENL